eukprot:s1566_g4.t1
MTSTETEDTGKNCILNKDSPEEKIQKSPEEKPEAVPLNEPPTNQLKTPDRGQKIDKEKDGEKSNSVKEKEAAKKAGNMMPDSPGSLGTTLVLSPNPRKRSPTAPSATSQKEPTTSKAKGVPKSKPSNSKRLAAAKSHPKPSKSPAAKQVKKTVSKSCGKAAAKKCTQKSVDVNMSEEDLHKSLHSAYSCGWKVGKVNNPGQKKQMAKVWYQAGVDARKKRLEEFRKAGDETDAEDTGIKTEVRNGERRDAEKEVLLQLDELTIFTPKGHTPLVEQINLQVKAGEALMLCGPSGVGKSSLLRVIAGLWHRGSGTIHRCAQKEMFFLPQELEAIETYLCLGSLRDNATYPKAQGSDAPSDTEIREAMEKVNLSYLVQRFGLDLAIDFDSCLSGGERQRLGFARLLLKRPSFAILDEATSALDRSNQEAMYSNLKRHVQGYVSVGHSASLEAFHTMKLVLERRSFCWDDAVV